MPEYGTAATEFTAKPLTLFVLRSQNGDSGPDTASPSITSLSEIALHASSAYSYRELKTLPVHYQRFIQEERTEYCHVISHDWCLAATELAVGRRYEAMTELYRWKGYPWPTMGLKPH
jgi:hypothetical protein